MTWEELRWLAANGASVSILGLNGHPLSIVLPDYPINARNRLAQVRAHLTPLSLSRSRGSSLRRRSRRAFERGYPERGAEATGPESARVTNQEYAFQVIVNVLLDVNGPVDASLDGPLTMFIR